MINGIIRQTSILEKGLDAAWLRNESISQNIANIDTPNYKKVEIQFEEQLKQALSSQSIQGKRTNESHRNIGRPSEESITPRLKSHTGTKMRVDGNNVDIDVEMANLANNTIYYNALTQKLMKDLQRIKLVINEGKR